jgi:predicted NAD/FAD-binding protein
MESQQRIAIVGSGLAGLVSAHLLQGDRQQRYAVKVFESVRCLCAPCTSNQEVLTTQGTSLSLDAASISIPNAAQTSSDRVDLPMRAFAGGFYSNLKALYDHLNVPYHSQRFLFEFAWPRNGSSTQYSSYFVHASNLHQVAPRPNAVGIIQYLIEVLYLIVCYSWFSVCCFLVAPHTGETLRHYLDRTRTPQHFVTYYLLPLISSVTTCPHEALLNFPASDVTEYKRRTNQAPHYTVSSGVQSVQERLIRGIDYELGVFVKAVEPQEKGVKLSWEKHGEALRSEYFDKVILAVAPDVVSQVFEPLRHHMARMPTAMVESVVHNDRNVLQESASVRTAADRHDAQLICLRTSTDNTTQTESHHVQSCGAIVTTCPYSRLDPSLVLHSAKFTRVLRSPESQRIVNAVFREGQRVCNDDKSVPQWRNGDDNVWLAGGWCWDGMVLLEGCVVSAMRIANALGVDVPWQQQQQHGGKLAL